MTTSAHNLSPGAVFARRYHIVRSIAAGGMGAVYEVLDTATDRRRALKVMLPCVAEDPQFVVRFEAEAKMTAKVTSEHLVEVMDAGVDAATGMPFLVMELLSGMDLAALRKTSSSIDPDAVLTYLSQAATALDKTHAAGIVHRDLKPQNLFLTQRDDGSPRIKILDFGIAKVLAHNAAHGQASLVMGTPVYMPPEQMAPAGQIGPEADVYALGHVAFMLLVGRPFWIDEWKSAASIIAFMHAVQTGPIERPSARAARWGTPLPPAFDAWFAQATAADPSQRFRRCSMLVAELKRALAMTSPSPTRVEDSYTELMVTRAADPPRAILEKTNLEAAAASSSAGTRTSLIPFGDVQGKPSRRRLLQAGLIGFTFMMMLAVGVALFWSLREPPSEELASPSARSTSLLVGSSAPMLGGASLASVATLAGDSASAPSLGNTPPSATTIAKPPVSPSTTKPRGTGPQTSPPRRLGMD